MKKTLFAITGALLFSPLAHASQPGFHQSVVADLEFKAAVFQALRDCNTAQAKRNSHIKFVVYPESQSVCRFDYKTPTLDISCRLPVKERNVVATENLVSVYHQLYTAYSTGSFAGGQLETVQANKIMLHSPYCASRK